MRNKLHLAMAVGLYMQGDVTNAEIYLKEVKFNEGTLPELKNCLMDRVMNDTIPNPIGMIRKLKKWQALNKQLTNSTFQQFFTAVYIKEAYKAYSKRQLLQTWRYAFLSMMKKPANVLNRGLIAIMVKSLIGRYGRTGSKPNPGDRYVMTKELEREIAQRFYPSQHTLETVKGGTSGVPIYKLNLDTRTYALRLLDTKVALARKKIVDAAVRLGVKAPRATTFPTRDEGAELSFWLDEWVEGQWFAPAEIGKAATEASLRELGEQFRALHAVAIKGFGYFKGQSLVSSFATFEQWLNHNHTRTLDSLFNARLSKSCFSQFLAADQYLSDYDLKHVGLIHGQLAYSNLLVNDGHLAAVIDWEEAQGCDPAYDLAILLKNMVFYEGPENEDLYTEFFLSGYKLEDAQDFRKRVDAFRVLIFGWESKWIPELFGEERMKIFEDAILKKQVG
jgi:aminoglycoside phosphotransferase (APT) family kinase protein